MKYDGKDASKCAMRGLRGNAFKILLDKIRQNGYNRYNGTKIVQKRNRKQRPSGCTLF